MYVILLIAVQFFLFSAVAFGLGKIISKSTGSFKAIIGSVGAASLPFSAAILINMLLLFIIPSLSIYVLLFGTITTIVLNFIGISESLKIKEDNNVIVVSLSYLIYYFIIITFISQNIKSKFTSLLNISSITDIFNSMY